MLKIVVIIVMLLFVTACQEEEAVTRLSIEPVHESVAPENDNNQIMGGSNHVEIVQNDTSGELWGYQPRQAWTKFDHYARVNEEGFAYNIFNDPDISSEISPITEGSDERILFFTFDDAPQAPDSYALQMAETLKAYDVNAVFLVNGMYMESEEGREITRKVHEMGFEIGNHTTTHSDMSELSYEDQLWELQVTNDMIEEITNDRVRWFRPPYGLYNLDTVLAANELGLQLITWTFGYDWQDEYLDGNALAEISLTTDYLHPGANILMHDRPWTLEALPRIIEGYREQGYHIVDPYLIQHQENSTVIHGLE